MYEWLVIEFYTVEMYRSILTSETQFFGHESHHSMVSWLILIVNDK